MISDFFRLAIRNLRKRKLRTWLTMLGIFISIATIFMLISLSLGLQGAVKEEFKTLGTDKFFVQPTTGFLGPPGSGGGTVLTEKDVDTIKKARGVKDVSSTTFGNAKVEFSKATRYVSVRGTSIETDLYIQIGDLEIEDGKFLEKNDRGAILGNMYKTKNLLGKPINVGNKITINGVDVKVRGIIKSRGNSDDDSMIMLDITTFREIFNIPERVDWVVVQINNGENIIDVADRVERDLRKERGVTEKTQDFAILTPEELLKSVQTILNIITAFLAGVAGISLLVGSVGIANTMYTSVLERTREIGVMKAIGAENKDIFTLFLIESGLLGLVGAIIGVTLGYGISKTIEFIARTQLNTNLLQAAAPIYLVGGCLIFGFLIGAVSGTLPAIRASKTSVVDALRYE